MQNKDSFVLYSRYIDIFKELTDEQAGQLIKTIFDYVNDNNPEPNGLIKIAFIPIKQQLKEDLIKWKEEKEKRSMAGKKGMESRYNTTKNDITNNNSVKNVITSFNKTNTIKNDVTNISDNDNVYVNDNDNEKINSNNIINNIITCIELPLIDSSSYAISDVKIDEWQQVYQAVDVKNELEKMKCWLNANPKNRKTRKGIERFIVAWLNRAQDKAPRVIPNVEYKKIETPTIDTLKESYDQKLDDDLIEQFKKALGE